MGIKQCLEPWFWFQTVKTVNIKNWRLGLLHYSIQLVILAYILFVDIIWGKGYQVSHAPISSTSIKLKGNAWVMNNATADPLDITMYDAIELQNPSEEADAIFITTNQVVTAQQTKGTCASTHRSDVCSQDSDCPSDLDNRIDIGVYTGVCDLTDNEPCNATGPDEGCCEVRSWCPLEEDDEALLGLQNVGNFTLFVRSNVYFPSYDIRLENIQDQSQLEPFYNLWSLEEILQMLDEPLTLADVEDKGCMLAFNIEWNCNFDTASEDCRAEFFVFRLDNPDSSLSSGYNYRTANYYYTGDNDDVYTRDLHKLMGTRIVFLSSGEGRKFNIVPLLTSLGAGMGLLAFATIAADMAALYLFANRGVYNEAKYEDLEDDSGLLFLGAGHNNQQEHMSIDEETPYSGLNNSAQAEAETVTL